MRGATAEAMRSGLVNAIRLGTSSPMIYDDKTGAISSEQVSKWFSFGSPCHFERPQHDGLGCS